MRKGGELLYEFHGGGILNNMVNNTGENDISNRSEVGYESLFFFLFVRRGKVAKYYRKLLTCIGILEIEVGIRVILYCKVRINFFHSVKGYMCQIVI